jgi:hypothetical protein
MGLEVLRWHIRELDKLQWHTRNYPFSLPPAARSSESLASSASSHHRDRRISLRVRMKEESGECALAGTHSCYIYTDDVTTIRESIPTTWKEFLF